jgi:WD40 repeat protein
MVARGAGDVGCAHCTVIGANRSCQVCTRLVCSNCGADWTTCPEPTGREVRLGRTARLRDVDPTGRIGLVTKWVGAMRCLDLRRLRWVDAELPRHHKVSERQILERLTPTGELYCSKYTLVGNDGGSAQAFQAVQKRSLESMAGLAPVVEIETEEPAENAGMTKDGDYYYVSSTQLVVVIAPDQTVRTFEPLPRRVVQACHVDLEAGTLASGTWGEIALHRIVKDTIEPLDRVRTTGNVSWVELSEPWLAACVDGHLRVWHVGENFVIGRETYQHVVGDPVRAANISRDGLYLAFGTKNKVLLHDLYRDIVITYEDHSDDICLVRFAGVDQMLVTADEDNRVVLRPRTSSGYVRSLIDLEIPSDPIKLALTDELGVR